MVTGNLAVANDNTGISLEGAAVIKGNDASSNKVGIDVTGSIGGGSTLIGSIANRNSQIGLRVSCPSTLSDNMAVNNGTNLVLNGTGCKKEQNVAP